MNEFWGFRTYVPVGQRRLRAAREMEKRRRAGETVSPVVIKGRAIVTTFWGQAWCENLERYSDFANRLPRGRTYVRNGSVVDLQIAGGAIKAFVCGSELYKVSVTVTPVAKARWKAICKDCAGAIESLVELLQGRFSKGVVERICRPNTGLFPSPSEIKLSCSCPDWAEMCKHVAAVLYGVGARLDQHPELLFRLHQVNEKELIATAGKGLSLPAVDKSKLLRGGEDLAGMFGLEIAGATDAAPIAARKTQAARKTAGKTAGRGKPVKTSARSKRAKPKRRKSQS